MNRLGLALAFVFACLISSASAEETGLLTRSYLITPKKGQGQQFVAAVKQHLQWLQDNGEPWNWSAYSFATGDRLGSFVYVSHGHSWNDFDGAKEHRTKSAKNWRDTVLPYVESIHGRIHKLDMDLSRLPETSSPATMARVTTIHLKPFARAEFKQRMRKISETIRQQDSPPPVLVYWLESGGGPRVTLVHPLQSWAESSRVEDALAQLKETLGAEAATIVTQLRELTEEVEESTLTLRPQLSFKAEESPRDLARN